MPRPKRSVVAAAEESSNPPDSLEPNQSLARVVRADGNNVFTCELPNKSTILLELAQRFRNTVWVKRGGYVLAEKFTTADQQYGRVVGAIVNVVGDERSWRRKPYWPKEFVKNSGLEDEEDEHSTVGKLPPSDSDDEH